MGDSPKWVKSKRRRKKREKERKRERAKVGDNNGQATHGACKNAWRTQAAWAKSVQHNRGAFNKYKNNSMLRTLNCSSSGGSAILRTQGLASFTVSLYGFNTVKLVEMFFNRYHNIDGNITEFTC